MENMVAIISLTLGLVIHICTTVWWASRITTILERSQSDIRELLADTKMLSATYVKKEDYVREIAHLEKRVQDVELEIDEINRS